MRKLIGKVPVDSGQVMIVDPCYLKDFENDEFNYLTGIQNGEKVYYCWQEIDGEKINWQTPIKAEGGKCMNELAQMEGWKQFSEYPDKGKFSYSGVSGVTCDEGYGSVKMDSGFKAAVASQSGWGDGLYPVYADIGKDGRVKSLTIEFTD